MPKDAKVKEVVVSKEAIEARIKEMAKEIAAEYAADETFFVIAILKSSMMFVSDLMKYLPGDNVKIDFVATESYGDEVESAGAIRLTKDICEDIKGKRVLLVDGIVDSGLTIKELLDLLHKREVADIKVATLLDKPSRRVETIPVDFVGFEIGNKFIVGYGMDFDQRYRNIPEVVVLDNYSTF